MSQRKFRWFHFTVLTSLGMLGVIAVFPYVQAIYSAEKWTKLLITALVQGAVFVAGATALSRQNLIRAENGAIRLVLGLKREPGPGQELL